MRANRISDSLYKLYTAIAMIAFGIIAFMKFNRVYETINFGEYSHVFAIATLWILLGGFLVIRCFSKRASYIYLFCMYSFLSIVSFIDCIYFSYNNKLPTIANINLIWMLKAVESSIDAINPMQFLWTVVDLLFILVYMVLIHGKVYDFIKKKLNKEYEFKYLELIISVLLVLSVLMSGGYAASIYFKFRYLKNELIVYHMIDIVDFLIEDDEEVDYEKYLNSQEVIKDEKYGIIANKNIVIIQVEALQNFVIDRMYNNQEITPFLNSLISDSSFYFNNYFYQVGAGNTSDAEFAVNNSILPSNSDAAYITYFENDYYGLPDILKENGYKDTVAFHAYKAEYWNRENAYVNQGFDKFFSLEDFSDEEIIGLGLSDEKFLQETASKMKEMQEPFYSFIITLSSHHPFYLEDEFSNIEVSEEHRGTLFGDYINSINYVDRALENFFDELKQNGLYENSVFLIYGDHFAIPNYNKENAGFVSDFLGYDYSYKDMFNVPFIIHIPGMNSAEQMDIVAGHVDVLPTLLHLLGIENDKSIMMGSDLFSIEENIVYEQTHVGIGSYITKDIFYYASNSGIELYNKAYDFDTGAEILITKEMIERSNVAKNTILDAKAILNANLIVH